MAISRVQQVLAVHTQVQRALATIFQHIDTSDYFTDKERVGIYWYAYWRYTEAYTFPSILAVTGWSRCEMSFYAFWLELYINQYLRVHAPHIAPLVGHPYLGNMRSRALVVPAQ